MQEVRGWFRVRVRPMSARGGRAMTGGCEQDAQQSGVEGKVRVGVGMRFGGSLLTGNTVDDEKYSAFDRPMSVIFAQQS